MSSESYSYSYGTDGTNGTDETDGTDGTNGVDGIVIIGHRFSKSTFGAKNTSS